MVSQRLFKTPRSRGLSSDIAGIVAEISDIPPDGPLERARARVSVFESGEIDAEILNLLDDSSGSRRVSGVRAALYLRRPMVYEALIRLLKAGDASVAATLEETLKAMPAAETRSILEELSCSGNRELRLLAAFCLGMVGATNTMLYVPILKRMLVSERSQGVFKRIVKSLVRIFSRFPSSLGEALFAELMEQTTGTEKISVLKQASARLTGRGATERRHDPGERGKSVLFDPKEARWLEREHLSSIRSALSVSDPVTRMAALGSMLISDGISPRDLRRVRSAATDPHPGVRDQAERVLRRFRDPGEECAAEPDRPAAENPVSSAESIAGTSGVHEPGSNSDSGSAVSEGPVMSSCPVVDQVPADAAAPADQDRCVAEARKALESGTGEARKHAISTILLSGRASGTDMELICALLGDPDGTLRYAAYRALKKLAPQRLREEMARTDGVSNASVSPQNAEVPREVLNPPMEAPPLSSLAVEPAGSAGAVGTSESTGEDEAIRPEPASRAEPLNQAGSQRPPSRPPAMPEPAVPALRPPTSVPTCSAPLPPVATLSSGSGPLLAKPVYPFRMWHAAAVFAAVVLGCCWLLIDHFRYRGMMADSESAFLAMRFGRAAEGYTAVLDKWPDDPAAVARLADIAIATGSRADAARMIRKLERVGKGGPEYSRLAAKQLLIDGRFGDAEGAYRKVLMAKGRQDPQARCEMALALRMTGDKAGGLSMARELCSEYPGFVEPRLLAAEIFRESGEIDKELGLLGEAVKINPEDPLTLRVLGAALLRKGAPSEAAGTLKKALDLVGGGAVSREIRYNLAVALSKSGSPDRALELLKGLTAEEPSVVDYRLQAALALGRAGRTDEEMAVYAEILKIDPDRGEAYYNMGIIHYGKGDLDGAKIMLERAVMCSPDCADYLFNLGSVLHMKGDLSGARWHYEQAIERDSGHSGATRNLALLNRG